MVRFMCFFLGTIISLLFFPIFLAIIVALLGRWYTHTHTHTFFCWYTHTHTHTHTHILLLIHTHARTHTHARIRLMTYPSHCDDLYFIDFSDGSSIFKYNSGIFSIVGSHWSNAQTLSILFPPFLAPVKTACKPCYCYQVYM